MTTKEILIAAFVALVTGILIVHYTVWLESSQDEEAQPSTVSTVEDSRPTPSEPTTELNDMIEQVKQLHHPNAPITVTFWLNVPGKIHFTLDDEITLYYKFNDNTDSKGYFSLFNVSPKGSLSVQLNNKPIQSNRIDSLPKSQIDWQPGQLMTMDTRISLEPGTEYFKAIVTSEPITLEVDMTKVLQNMTFWGTSELTVFVSL